MMEIPVSIFILVNLIFYIVWVPLVSSGSGRTKSSRRNYKSSRNRIYEYNNPKESRMRPAMTQQNRQYPGPNNGPPPPPENSDRDRERSRNSREFDDGGGPDFGPEGTFDDDADFRGGFDDEVTTTQGRVLDPGLGPGGPFIPLRPIMPMPMIPVPRIDFPFPNNRELGIQPRSRSRRHHGPTVHHHFYRRRNNGLGYLLLGLAAGGAAALGGGFLSSFTG